MGKEIRRELAVINDELKDQKRRKLGYRVLTVSVYLVKA